ncbi:MAG: hypothetical protein ACK4Z5_01030 [Brevundimonas sp.]
MDARNTSQATSGAAAPEANAEPRRRFAPSGEALAIPQPRLMDLMVAGVVAAAWLLAVPASAGPGSEASCQAWFARRPAHFGAAEPIFNPASPALACLDGAIEPEVRDAVLAWIGSPAEGKMLGVRSRGGDAEVGLDLAEALQTHQVEVAVSELCASACANYLFAGAPVRSIDEGSLLLFHGGYSERTRRAVISELERFFASPSGVLIENPAENRATVMAGFDRNLQRQSDLYRAVSVSEQIVTAVDAIDLEALDPSACGGESERPRNFIFFSRSQLQSLGLAARRGEPLDDPAGVNRRLEAAGLPFAACQAPADALSAEGHH